MIHGISSNQSVGLNSRTNQANPNVCLPDFMLSRTEPAMSEDAFRERIEEMARRDAKAGRFQSHDINSEFHQLRQNFISPASPNRQGMINAAFPTMIGKIRQLAQSNPPVKTLLELLLLGKEIPQIPPNGQQLVLFQLKDENGNLLAELTTGGWTKFSTDAENAKNSEFLAIYNTAWRAARAEMESDGKKFTSPKRQSIPSERTFTTASSQSL